MIYKEYSPQSLFQFDAVVLKKNNSHMKGSYMNDNDRWKVMKIPHMDLLVLASVLKLIFSQSIKKKNFLIKITKVFIFLN